MTEREHSPFLTPAQDASTLPIYSPSPSPEEALTQSIYSTSIMYYYPKLLKEDRKDSKKKKIR